MATETTVAPSPTRIRVLAGVVFVGSAVLTALCTFAAVDTGPGESREMFTLLAGSTAVGALGAMAAILALRAGGGPWLGLEVGALVVSVALVALAATRDGGAVLPLTMLPLLLAQWWLLRGLRQAVSR